MNSLGIKLHESELGIGINMVRIMFKLESFIY